MFECLSVFSSLVSLQLTNVCRLAFHRSWTLNSLLIEWNSNKWDLPLSRNSAGEYQDWAVGISLSDSVMSGVMANRPFTLRNAICGFLTNGAVAFLKSIHFIVEANPDRLATSPTGYRCSVLRLLDDYFFTFLRIRLPRIHPHQSLQITVPSLTDMSPIQWRKSVSSCHVLSWPMFLQIHNDGIFACLLAESSWEVYCCHVHSDIYKNHSRAVLLFAKYDVLFVLEYNQAGDKLHCQKCCSTFHCQLCRSFCHRNVWHRYEFNKDYKGQPMRVVEVKWMGHCSLLQIHVTADIIITTHVGSYAIHFYSVHFG